MVVDETGVDETVDETGVDETVVDETGVDELGCYPFMYTMGKVRELRKLQCCSVTACNFVYENS